MGKALALAPWSTLFPLTNSLRDTQVYHPIPMPSSWSPLEFCYILAMAQILIPHCFSLKAFASRFTCYNNRSTRVDCSIECRTCYPFLCVWLLHPCGLLCRKLHMSCHVVCLWQSLDSSRSTGDSVPPSLSLRWKNLDASNTSTHHTHKPRRQSRPLSCANKQGLRQTFKIMRSPS